MSWGGRISVEGSIVASILDGCTHASTAWSLRGITDVGHSRGGRNLASESDREVTWIY